MKTNLLKALFVAGAMIMGTNAWAENEDFLSQATKIEWNSTDVTSSYTSGVLTVTPSSTSSDMALTLTGSQSISNGQTLLVLETSSNFKLTGDNNTHKVRNITVNGNKFDYTSACDWSTKSITVGSETHTLIIFSPINKSRSCKISDVDTNIFDYYGANSSMTLTTFGFNFRTTDTQSFKVYRAGFYTVAQILTLYSGVSPMRWVNNGSGVRYEFGGSENKIDANGSTTNEYSAQQAGVLYKTLGALPNTITNVNYRYINVTSGTPLTEDVFAGNEASGVLCHSTVAQYFPTEKKNLKILSSRFYQYKDGSLAQNMCQDNTTYNYASYVRSLKVGYSTCILPFDVTYDVINKAGLTAYTFSSFSDGRATFAKLTTGSIAANTPFVVKATKAGLYSFSATLSGTMSTITEAYKPTTASNNVSFVGSYKSEAPLAGTYADHTCGAFSEDGTGISYMTSETNTNYYRAFIDYGKNVEQLTLESSYDDDNLYVETVAAKIGTTNYPSIAAAIAGASAGTETITVACDQTLASKLEVTKAVTIDGNSKTLTIGQSSVVGIAVTAGATIKNCTVDAADGGKPVFEFSNTTDAITCKIEGVTVKDGKVADQGVYRIKDKATVTLKDITNSNITVTEGKGEIAVCAAAAACNISGTCTVNSIYLEAGKRANLSGATISNNVVLNCISTYTSGYAALTNVNNNINVTSATTDWQAWKSKTSGSTCEWALSKNISTYSLEVTAGAATLVLPYEAVIPSGVKAYTLNYNDNAGTAKATFVEGNLAANTPVYLVAANGTYSFESAAGATCTYAEAPTKGALIGYYGASAKEITYDESNSHYYVLSKEKVGDQYVVGFFQAKKTKVYTCHAYMKADNAADARSFIGIDFGGETTGINNANVSASAVKSGKFIENGRVVIVKEGKKFNMAGQLIK